MGRDERSSYVFSLKVFLSAWDGDHVRTAVYTCMYLSLCVCVCVCVLASTTMCHACGMWDDCGMCSIMGFIMNLHHAINWCVYIIYNHVYMYYVQIL